jgi:hypothetical protein
VTTAAMEQFSTKPVRFALDTALQPATGEKPILAALAPTRPKQRPLFRRAWKILLRAGQYRAVCEVGRYLRMRGLRPTGNLDQDVATLLALRGHS